MKRFLMVLIKDEFDSVERSIGFEDLRDGFEVLRLVLGVTRNKRSRFFEKKMKLNYPRFLSFRERKEIFLLFFW